MLNVLFVQQCISLWMIFKWIDAFIVTNFKKQSIPLGLCNECLIWVSMWVCGVIHSHGRADDYESYPTELQGKHTSIQSIRSLLPFISGTHTLTHSQKKQSLGCNLALSLTNRNM